LFLHIYFLSEIFFLIHYFIYLKISIYKIIRFAMMIFMVLKEIWLKIKKITVGDFLLVIFTGMDVFYI